MIAKRQLLSELLYPLSVVCPVRPSVAESEQVLVLGYHGIDDTAIEGYPLDDACISATSAQFESQLRFLKRHFTVLTFHDLHDAYISRGRMPKRGVIITLDDGYRNNYTRAFPLLKQHGLPATVFLATGYIGTNQRFWFDDLSLAVMQSRHRRIEMTWNGSSIQLDLSDHERRREAYVAMSRLAKRLSEEQRVGLLRALGERLGAPDPGIDGRHVLDWAEVSEMAGAGIEFGSHTVTHPILARVDDGQAAREIIDSKAQIERHTGRECVVFSYPNGQVGDFGEREKRLLEEAGYRFAVSYIHGVEPWARADRYALRRLHVERDTTRAMFRLGCGWWPRLM